MAVWRVLVRLSVPLHDLGGDRANDATSFAHRSSSRNYAERVGDAIESVKASALVDRLGGTFLDVHCPENLPHDTQIGWRVLIRNLDQVETVAADKGLGSNELPSKLRV